MTRLAAVAADMGQAIRMVRRQPGFAAIAILLLAVGTGAAVSVFALVNAVLLASMPFADSARLSWMYNERTERDRAPLSIPDLEDYAREAASLDGLAAFTNWTANVTGAGDAERLEGVRVAGGFFDVLGTRAALGRTLGPADERDNTRAAVITDGLWKRRFGADREIVGAAIVLNGAAYTLVGVLPASFAFPFRYAEIAVPLVLQDDPRRTDRGANFVRVVARVKRGVSLAQAERELDTIAGRLQHDYPEDDARKIGVSLYPLQAEIVRDYAAIFWALFGAVCILVLVGCGNLTNLLLVRSAGRRSELALRVSLGARRSRVVRQLALEAALLALCGGSVGVLLALATTTVWPIVAPADFPQFAPVTLDGRVMAFAVTLSLAVAVASGGVPAWLATRDLAGALAESSRRLAGNRREGAIRRLFVGIQIAGASALLACGGLAARSLARIEGVDPGFTADRALTVQLSFPPNRYVRREAIAQFADALAVRLANLSGVRHAGAVSLLPLSGLLATMDLEFPERPGLPPDQVPQAHFRIATPGYFAAAGIRLVSGREFQALDTGQSAPVAVVSEAFAARHWPGESATGRHVRILQSPPSPLFEIVGVVRNVKQYGLDGDPTADLYVPLRQVPPAQAALMAARMYWVLRPTGDGHLLAAEARDAVRAVDPDVAASSVRTLEEILSGALGSRRINVRLLEFFGEAAILLAGFGTYAIVVFAAGARRRELAIRTACGAGRQTLVWLLLRGELPSLLSGLATGLAAAALVARSLGDLLFATAPLEPAVYGWVALMTAVAVLGATYLPARRAASDRPAEVLRM